jgi:predicted Zn-dependent protease
MPAALHDHASMNRPIHHQTQTMNAFTLDEAVALIYRLAVRNQHLNQDRNTKPSITEIGHVCGVLTLNDQIELVIKFHDELRQFTKAEFCAEVTLLD